MKILCFGSLNIDHVYKVDDFVRPGETKKCHEYFKTYGGKGLNQSVALAKSFLAALFSIEKWARQALTVWPSIVEELRTTI